jgi:hypothetical protein
MTRLVTMLLAALSLSGCLLAESEEELARLVKEDPAFKLMVIARDESRRQIALIKKDLLSRKNTIDAQVAKLRGDYDAVAKAQNARAEEFRAAIRADREKLKQELELAIASLEKKQLDMAGFRRTLADLKKVLTEGKGLALSKNERQKWEEKTLMLSEKMRPLSEEIQDLKLQIRLKKQKIGYLS